MEGTHGQLRTGLAYGLGGDDAYGLAYVYLAAGCQVGAVAVRAHAVLAAAGEYAAAAYGLYACVDYTVAYAEGYHLVAGDYELTGGGIVNVLCGVAAQQPVAEGLYYLVAFHNGAYGHALWTFAAGSGTVLFADYDVLRYVHQSSGEITGVCSTQCSIRQALSGAVGAYEELQNCQALTEVSPYRHLYDLAGRVCHKSAHTCQLTYLVLTASGSGVRHHSDGVVGIEGAHQRVGNFIGSIFPDLYDVAPALAVGKHTGVEQVVYLRHLILGLGDNFLLLRRYLYILEAYGYAAAGGILIAQRLYGIQHLCGAGGTVLAVAAVDYLSQILLYYQLIDLQLEHVVQRIPRHIAQILRYCVVEYETAYGGVYDAAVLFAFPFALYAHLHLGLEGDFAHLIGHEGLVLAAEDLALALHAVALEGQVVAAKYHILSRTGNGLAVLRLQYVV